MIRTKHAAFMVAMLMLVGCGSKKGPEKPAKAKHSRLEELYKHEPKECAREWKKQEVQDFKTELARAYQIAYDAGMADQAKLTRHCQGNEDIEGCVESLYGSDEQAEITGSNEYPDGDAVLDMIGD